MRIVIFILLLFSSLNVFAQKISYTVPAGYEKYVSKEEYKRILDLSLSLVAKRYTVDHVKDGAIHLKEGQEIQTLNLHNLLVTCSSVLDRSQWSLVIQEHFGKIFDSIDEQKRIDPENYESIKKYLSIRIYPEHTVNERGGTGSLVAKIDLEGTYTLLMLDLPGAFVPVEREAFKLWKKDSTEVFKVAQANINRQSIEKVTEVFDIDGSKIEISFLGNEDYASSYALDLVNNSPEMVGEWGSVLAMPNKGLVELCKVSKAKPVDFVKFIQRTMPMVEKSYEEHTQPISDQYFWYYKGKFTRIMVVKNEKGINVVAPFGLTELMTEKK